ncbi:glucosamine-6-phosphate deaminase [Alkalicoccus daliensis]|uniref:Glucosamine-6-phosphate deaminase n=1 Tax=Alkalicoccus daliensis TaxID=745820 RepID=A0A1H0EU12_9BACI|nr:glucosamine-6-phosphate deaminase [Alkalicoccus daliensis]SDN85881.1 glucosamine-6-phosphate deaminase [Alkalicoccus daliensis]
MKIIKAANYENMSKRAADLVYRELKEKQIQVLGLATGGTPIGFYQEIIKEIQRDSLSLDWLYTVNLDEYIGLSPDHRNSYHAYMKKHFFQYVDIPLEQQLLPDGMSADPDKEAKRYEKLVEELGVDLQILGLGQNGHIGFNEPGSSFKGKTSVVDLAPSTIDANARFFEAEEEVPKQAITMGIATIMRSRKIILLASGAEKAEALKEVITGEVTEKIPGTILQQHLDITIIADKEALSLVE